jgi:formimidoylglutamate deiminase
VETEVSPATAAPRRFFAPLAYLPDGWARNVAMAVDARGFFTAVVADSADDGAERLAGVVLPGMVNAHSHAFQRAMVGLTQVAGPDADNFWSWRTLMYELALRLSPSQIEAIATWVYTEMLRGGYTHVCEFHYLHNDEEGRPYADPAELSRAVLRAAQRVGIGITLLPVLYMASGFGGQSPRVEQRRFLSTPERLLDVVRNLRAEFPDDPMLAFGLAPHSLRAVPPAALRYTVAGLRAIDPGAPVHVHIAEQTAEIDACLAWSGQRPVDWLLEHEAVDRRWNLVHATHMTMDESLRVAESGATVVLCPTTEADLGDGVFAYPEYVHANGGYAIGSDSQVCRDWQSELRMLEYSQRLALRERNVAATPGRSTGDVLFSAALAGGAKASGMPLSRLAAGGRADWVVVREDKLAFAGRAPERYLDSLIFDHHAPDFADIVIGGHSRRAALEGDDYHAARAGFARTLREVSGA